MTTTQTTTTYYIEATGLRKRHPQYFKCEIRDTRTRQRVVLMRSTTGAKRYTDRQSAEATCETLTRLYWQIQWTVVEMEA